MNRILSLSMATLTLVFVLTGCQTPTPLQEARNRSLRPGTLVDQRIPQDAPQQQVPQDGYNASVPDSDRTRAVLAELEKRDATFNKRLKGVLGKGAGPQFPRRGSSGGTGQTIKSETMKVNFDFFDADLADVVRLFMELLKDNYALDSKVAGKVALHVDAEMSRDEIWELFRGVLRMHGASLILDNGVWRILPLADVATSIDENGIVYTADSGERRRGQSVQVFKLDYLPVTEFSNVVKPYLSPGSMIYGHEQTGVTLVADFPHTLRKIEKLVEIFDVSAFAGLHMRVFSLKYVKAEEAIKELDGVIQSTMLKQQGREKVTFLGLPRLNMIVALTWNEANLGFVEEWIRELDREEPAAVTATQQENIFVYYVENGDAGTITDSLEGLFNNSRSAGRSSTNSSSSRARKGSTRSGGSADTLDEKDLTVGQQISAQEKKKSSNIIDFNDADKDQPRERVGFSGELGGPVSFVVDEATNAILVRCQGEDYKIIKGVIEKLDIFPRQVLIEVLIAEVALDENNKLGVEWRYIMDLGGDATGVLDVDSNLGLINTAAKVPIASGLSYLIANTERFRALIKASADQNNVQILSSPHILASDNQEASIDVGSEVPVVTSQTQKEDTTSTVTTTQQNVQYRNTGILLKVTPHINDKGLVRMEVSQEVSELSDKQVSGVSSPVFNKRSAETTLAVKDGQTIVIGGLIRKTKTDTYSGIPGLGNIPFIRNLFGVQQKAWVNTELLLFITPHVIEHSEDTEFVTQNFLQRLEHVKRTVSE